jgi:hypothetical protein
MFPGESAICILIIRRLIFYVYVVAIFNNTQAYIASHQLYALEQTCDLPARETESTAFETLSRPPEKN